MTKNPTTRPFRYAVQGAALLLLVLLAMTLGGCHVASAASKGFPDQQGPYGTPPWKESPGGYVGDNGTPTPQDWNRDVANIDTAIAANPTAPLMFVGDSITYREQTVGKAEWDADFASRATDAGIGGDTPSTVDWRADTDKQFAGATPQTVVLLIGTNSFHHFWDPAQVTFGVIRTARTLHAKMPGANVVVVSLLPKYDPTSPEWNDVVEVDNALAAQVPHMGSPYSYLNVWSQFVTYTAEGTPEQTPGLFNSGGVHPTAAGYVLLNSLYMADPLIGALQS